MAVLNFVINILRSVPFLILMVVVIPLSRFFVGTSIGTTATIVPLIVAAFPFVARLVESSLREVDGGVVEAALSMGCSPFQVITKVMIPESRPSLISGFTTAFITILSYGAMAGAIGGGGLGSMSLMLGYQRRNEDHSVGVCGGAGESWCRSSSPSAPGPPSAATSACGTPTGRS